MNFRKKGLLKFEVDETGPRSCLMVRIGVCSVEPSGSATGVSVNLLVGCISSFMV